MTDYTTKLEIPNSRHAIFMAISGELGKWWGEQDRLIEKKDTVFKVSWGEPWYQFKVTEYKENELMIWECIDANQLIPGLTGVEKEWVGTKILWNLTEISSNATLLLFKHQGLTPDFLCFDFCSSSWEHFLKDRLVAYLAMNH